MNTVEALYRYLQKIGPVSFDIFVKEHPEFSEDAKKAKLLCTAQFGIAN